MSELAESIAVEQEHVEASLKHIAGILKKKRKGAVELAALGVFIQGIYNGMERIIKQALILSGHEVSRSKTWHRDLIKAAVKHGLISPALAVELTDCLGFRHFFTHSYGTMIDRVRITRLAEKMPSIWRGFISEVKQNQR